MGKVVPHLKLFLLLIGLSMVIFALDRIQFLTLPKSGAYFITNPVSFSIYKTKQSLSKQLYFMVSSRKAAQGNRALQEQLGVILSENANLRRNLAEVEALLEQEAHLDPKTYNLLAARPVGLDRYLKIDKGSSDGVKAGAAVVFKDNYIGQVTEVSEKGASVRLPLDPDSKIAVFAFGKEGKAKGVALGQFGVEILMDKILHEEKITEGDLVYSEGMEGYLPRGLILGKVTKVLGNQNDIFKQAKVEILFDIRDLELVFVMRDSL